MDRTNFEHYVPLPPNFELTPHTGTIASHLAAFHGAWGGVWGDELRHILLVDAIRPTGEADAIYATGDYLQWGAEGSWRRSVANIDELNLKIKWPHATVTYLFDGPSRLIAQYVMADGHSTTGLLQRISSTALGSRHLLEDVVSAGERVFLPHSTRPILLEARLYRHHEMKRAPLAIMNHGSAMGRDVHAGRSEFAQARWLMSNGYHVLVPMRRGRGLSQGEYGEDNYGRDASGTIIDVSAGVNEAVEDLASAITFGLSLPFVEAGPVLLMGQSRGGFLAAVYAGRHPQAVSGVVNFVGGWRGGGASEALNTPFFAEAGGGSGKEVPHLWLYGDSDPYYGEAHIRANMAAFVEAGGVCQFEFYTAPERVGHGVANYPHLWQPTADRFIESLRK